jgi:asparagine synthase (glutamine-hydrolysing)
MTPEGEWFKSDGFKILIREIIDSDSFRNRNIIDPDKARRIYENHVSGRSNRSKEIWKWINLELWFREFIDN